MYDFTFQFSYHNLSIRIFLPITFRTEHCATILAKSDQCNVVHCRNKYSKITIQIKYDRRLFGPVHPISFNNACTLLNTYPCTANIKCIPPSRKRLINYREDQYLLAKLRYGHYVGLRAYKNWIDPSTSPTCNLYNHNDRHKLF